MMDVCRKYGHCTDFVVMFNCRSNNKISGLILTIRAQGGGGHIRSLGYSVIKSRFNKKEVDFFVDREEGCAFTLWQKRKPW